MRPHLALVGPVPPPRAERLAHPGCLPRAEGGVERGVVRAELAATVAPAPLLHAAHGDGHLRVGRHQHGGGEDAVLLGADQLLAIQQQERPVGPVRHLEERDAAGLAHLGDAGVGGFAPHPALSPSGRGWSQVIQREPVGVVEVGGEERDDGEGAVGHGLAGQEGGEELGDLGDFLQLGHGWILLWRCGGPSVYPRCDREGRRSRCFRLFSFDGRSRFVYSLFVQLTCLFT